MYATTAIELLSQLGPDETVVIQWYSKQHVEENLDTQLSAEEWEYICDNHLYASMDDFGISELLSDWRNENESD